MNGMLFAVTYLYCIVLHRDRSPPAARDRSRSRDRTAAPAAAEGRDAGRDRRDR